MEQTDEDAAIWRAIAERNDWRLVGDAAAFARVALQGSGDTPPERGAVEEALLHAYRRRMYHALRANDDRAAYELHRICYLRARASGLDEYDAHEAAQETMRRVVERLPDLQAPEAIVAWALTIQRRMVRDRAARISSPSLEQGLASGAVAEQVAPDDVAAAVEERIVGHALAALVRRVLQHPMERLAVERIVLGGDKPREVARDLGLPLHQIRVHKSRALQRLRADPFFEDACAQLALVPDDTARDEGGGP